MKKQILTLLLILALLVGKYFLSPCSQLPEEFYSAPMYATDLNFHYEKLDSPCAKALVWLGCYLSVPKTTSLHVPDYASFPAGLRFGEEGAEQWMFVDEGLACTIGFFDGDLQKAYVTLPGLGGSLYYLLRDHMDSAVSQTGGDAA